MNDERIVEFVSFLRDSQYWPAERIKRYQERALAQLVSYAYHTIPFYSVRLKPLFSRPFGPHLEHWDEVPVLKREDVLKFRRAMTSVAVPEEFGRTHETSTSGSTGKPVIVTNTTMASVANQAIRVRSNDWFGFDPTRVLVHIVSAPIAYPDGEVAPHWNPVYRKLGVSGTFGRLGINNPIEHQLEWLRRMRPAYIQTFVNILVEIADRVKRTDPDIRPERVLAGGEFLSDEHRRRIESGLGASVLEHYLTQEVGNVAAECPDCGQMHCADEVMRVELLDDRGADAGPGSSGRVIITPFYNYAMPLIRYEIGDRAIAGQPNCTRAGLTAIERMLGRFRTMFRFPDGSVVWPTIKSFNLLQVFRYDQYRLIQHRDHSLEFQFVAENDPSDSQAGEMKRYIRDCFSQPGIGVTLIRVAELQRDASGKYQDYVSHVPAPQSDPDRA